MNQTIKRFFPYVILFLICPFFLWLVNVFSLVSDPIITGKNSFPSTNPTEAIESSTSNPSPVNISKYQFFAYVENVPEGTFHYGGSTTWAQTRKIVDPKIQAALPNFKMTYMKHPNAETPGSGTGIRMLLNNQLDFSVSSRPLKPEEKQQGLIQKEVAIDSIAIAVNHKLKLQQLGLTIDQLKGIYTGKITNWKKVGGPDIKITPYTRHPEDGGTVEYFLNDVLKIKVEELGPNVESVQDTTSGLRKVKENPGGIYYASAPEVVGQCVIKPLPLGSTLEKFFAPYTPPFVPPDQCLRSKNRITVNTQAIRSGDYPITRKLFVIIKQYDQTKQLAGEAYANLLLSEEGQELLEKAGFVRLN